MRLTLGQFFTLSLLALALALGGLFYVVSESSRATVIEGSERLREEASREIDERVSGYLSTAPRLVKQFQNSLERGLVDARDPLAVEQALFAALLTDDHVSEVSLTFGRRLGFAENGESRFAESPRGQISVWRLRDEGKATQFQSRYVHQEGGKFVADVRKLARTERFSSLPVERTPETALTDPTTHLTFVTPARRDFYGQLVWSDLQWAPLDLGLPEKQRRVVVSVQQALQDAAGEFAGVLRVGLLTQELDRVVQLTMSGRASADPQQIFLCDDEGRLITRGVPGDPVREDAGDLRIDPAAVPKAIAAALKEKTLHAVDGQTPTAAGHLNLAGEEYLTTFHALPGTQDWIVGIVVPRSFYFGKLAAMRHRLLAISLGIMAVLVLGGGLILRGVKAAQARIVRESRKMNAFEFSPSSTDAPFRDVSAVLESLEQAKTAMRAMGKYLPIDLVRKLYHDRSEPVLGGEDHEISLMFTDIKDFTTASETLAPCELAGLLGRYLEVMARVIQRETGGTIDKYIGDAIMTFWNAPEPVPAHAKRACLAALRCSEASEELFRSPEWEGHSPFLTRYGLHCDVTLVGHFGAPDRMNYTAIGDGVNLASRLEGLNKYYGTSIIASERIVERAREEYDFRLLDWVAVKGKTEGIRIYELVGRKSDAGLAPAMRTYEQAFAAYLARDFAGAAALLAAQPEDPPSVRLLARCRRYEEEPPPAEWSGVYIATAK